MTNEAKRLERTAVIRLDHAREWLERQLHSTAVDIPRQFVYPLLADYAISETIECSRLASRVEELENSIRDAMSAAGGRWEEWGGRAMLVREILDKLLAGAHAEEK